MEIVLNAWRVSYICIALLFLSSCSTNDVGEDTDGPTGRGLPEVTTRSVLIFDDAISAEGGGELLDEGSSRLISKGVCWSTEPNPTIDDNTTNDGVGIGEFTSSITGLNVNTKYYIRAYATNQEGTSYGGEIDFFTAKIFSGNVVLSSQEEVNDFGKEKYLIVNGDFFIGRDGGSDITTLEPLKELNQIRGNLFIGSRSSPNPLLKNLDGLDFLALVQSITFTKFNIRIENNDSLEQIDGLKGLGLFEGDIQIIDNPSLTNIDGLERITEVDNILMNGNPSLVNLKGLANIEEIKSLSIIGSHSLTAINELDNIGEFVTIIILVSNVSLTDISSLSKIKSISNLRISDNPSLVDFSPLNKLERISGTLNIINTGITNLDDFQSLITVGNDYTPPGPLSERDVNITDNQNLTDFCGIRPLLQSSEFTGEVRIRQNLFNPSTEDILDEKCMQ